MPYNDVWKIYNAVVMADDWKSSCFLTTLYQNRGRGISLRHSVFDIRHFLGDEIITQVSVSGQEKYSLKTANVPIEETP